jgi:hypothetical protein
MREHPSVIERLRAWLDGVVRFILPTTKAARHRRRSHDERMEQLKPNMIVDGLPPARVSFRKHR